MKTVQQAIEHAAHARPRNGFTFQDMKGNETFFSFVELERASAMRAAGLARLGLVKGDRIALSFPEPKGFVLTFLGAVHLGVIAVPIIPPPIGDRSAYLDRIQRTLAVAEPRFLITAAALVEKFQPLIERVASLEAIIAADSLQAPPPLGAFPQLAADDVAFLQFTSGSTGDPRGVIVTHRMLMENTRGILGEGGVQADPERDKGVCWLPLYHDMGLVGFVVAPLCWSSSTLFLPTMRFLRNPSVWMDAMHRHRATVSWAPNFAYALAARAASEGDLERWDLSCVRVLGCGGEPINPGVIRDFNKVFCGPTGLSPNAVHPSYGLAESTLMVTVTPIADGMRTLAVDATTFEREGRASMPVNGGRAIEQVCVGRVIAGHDVRIVDPDGEALPDGHEGEVLVSGPSVTPGYFRDAAGTAAIRRGDWLRTGDFGFTCGGELFVTGRIKDLIVYNGHNVAPQAVEWSAASVPGVRAGSVAAFSVPGVGTERVVLALEVYGSNPDQIVAEVKTRVQLDLMLPLSEVLCVRRGGLPKTSSGKLQRWKVRDDYLKGRLATVPSNERPMAAILAAN